MPSPSRPLNSARAHIDKEAENGQAIGASGGGAEVPVEFLVEVYELYLGGEHKEWGPQQKGRGEWVQLRGSQIRSRISAQGGGTVFREDLVRHYKAGELGGAGSTQGRGQG